MLTPSFVLTKGIVRTPQQIFGKTVGFAGRGSDKRCSESVAKPAEIACLRAHISGDNLP
jgi:hypothetical protein